MTTGEPSLVDLLRGALGRREILAFFQPQVDPASGRIVAAEALARWRHPEHGIVSPDIFIPAAQQHRIIDDLGLFMVNEAWRAALNWNESGTPVEVSVNVSATQLTSDRLTDHLRRLLIEATMPAQAMTIEITESEPFFDLPEAAERLRKLTARGLGISVDDFGLAHSSLARLNDLPATEVKIDISMVQDESDEGDASIRAIVEYAHELGVRVVAEGIETESQRDRVVELGVERAQGFLFYRPMDRMALTRLLDEQFAAQRA